MEIQRGPIETAVLKVALQQNEDTICRVLKCGDFCSVLFTKLLLTIEEHDHLKRELTNKGPTAQYKELLGYVVKKASVTLWKIIGELKLYNQEIYTLIEKTVQGINNGSVSLQAVGENTGRCSAVAKAIGVILTEEIRNIIEERFNQELKKSRYRSLKDALKHKHSLIDSFSSGSNANLGCLFKRQYKSLFHSANEVVLKNQDMALVIYLCRVLFEVEPDIQQNWDVMPYINDNRLAAELMRVNCFRNTTYGYLLKPGDEWGFNSDHWLLFLRTLSNLGAPIETTNRYQALLLFPDAVEMDKDKEYLKSWITCDKQSMMLILETLDHHLVKRSPTFSDLKTLCDLVKSDFHSNFLKLFVILEKLPLYMLEAALLHTKTFKLDPQLQAIEEAMQEKLTDVETLVEHASQTTKIEITDKLAASHREFSQQHQIAQEKLTTICVDQKVAIDKIDVLHKVRSGDENSSAEREPISYTKEMLLSEADAFRVLILSQPENRQHEDMEDFCKALGCIPWDVIIDLDHFSRTQSGLHERIAKVLELTKDYQVVSYNNHMKCISDTEKRIIASGERTLWFLANGCDNTRIESLQKPGKALTAIEDLLKSVFSKTPGLKPIFFWNIILASSEAVPGFGKKLLQRFDDICETFDDSINGAQSFFRNLYTEENFKRNIPDVKMAIEQKSAFVTYQDVVQLFKGKLEKGDTSHCFYYPGSDNRKCQIPVDQMVQYQVYFELYHLDIGEVDFIDMKEEDLPDYMERQKTDFLKGKLLTPYAQFVHSKCQVYVEREEMKSAKHKVITLLQEREEWHQRKYNGHFTISHDASGGGTTTARYILYSLKNSYPCLEIKRLERQTTKYLKKIFKESRKPLLVVLDDHDFTSKNADELQQELTNDHIKALVLHVERKKLTPLKPSTNVAVLDDFEDRFEDVSKNRTSCQQVSSQLQKADEQGFRLLYQQVSRVIKASKVILFGLLAFCEDYEPARLNEHISEGLQNSTENQIEALSIVLFIWKYCQKPVKLKLLHNFPSESNHENIWQSIFGYCNSDFVKEDKSDKYAVCPVHQCVIEPILQAIRKRLFQKQESKVLTWFTSILYQSISRNDTVIDESSLLCRHLFIERAKEGYTSRFVKDFGDFCGKQCASELILKFTRLYKGMKHEGHMRALYARYLTYQLNLPEKGLKEIALAVNLRCGQTIEAECVTNEAAVLGTYGYLFRNKACATFTEYIAQSNPDAAIHESLRYFQEAIIAFQKAQKSSLDSQKYSAEPFLGEVKVRYKLLTLCMRDNCKKNFANFRKFLKETKCELIQESDEKAIKVLETLDNLQRLNRLDEISERTSKYIVSLKFMLLKLRFDDRKTKKDLLSSAVKENNICFDIGLLVRLEYDKIQSVEQEKFKYDMRHWNDLSNDQLVIIIEFVGRRLEHGTHKILACNLWDLINAMLHLRYRCKPDEYPQYNLKYAFACVEYWTSSFPDDHRSIFTLGCLYLVRGIEEDCKRDVIQGVEHLTKCEEIYSKNRSARYVMTRRWAFGSGTGLNRLVPYKKDNPHLYTFKGRQTVPRSKMIGVKPFQDILIAKMYWDEANKADDGRQSNLQFNICLRQKDPIVAFNVEKV